MSASIPDTLGRMLEDRLETLAEITDKPGELTRLYLTPAFRKACDQVARWMEDAGMTAWVDPVGNVVGRYEGARSDLPTLLLGSHIDTVRNAGKYDGMLGVLAAIACVQALNDSRERLPYAIEVWVFGNEEGVRFPTILTGSRAAAGTLDRATLEARDADGISVREALVAMGCDPEDLSTIAKQRENLLGFLELHIEQGPVLEAEDLPLGIVTAISGACRYRIQVTGEAGHAGTVPMDLRRDALTAAAEMALAVEGKGKSDPALVATVGHFEVISGASNVIPGKVCFTVDLRAPIDVLRDRAAIELFDELRLIAERRNVDIGIERFYEAGAAACSPALIAALEASVERAGILPRKLPSGAGHDGQAIAALCPIAMLFLRCKGGISHNPAEAIDIGDAVIATGVMLDFLLNLDPQSLTA